MKKFLPHSNTSLVKQKRNRDQARTKLLQLERIMNKAKTSSNPEVIRDAEEKVLREKALEAVSELKRKRQRLRELEAVQRLRALNSLFGLCRRKVSKKKDIRVKSASKTNISSRTSPYKSCTSSIASPSMNDHKNNSNSQ